MVDVEMLDVKLTFTKSKTMVLTTKYPKKVTEDTKSCTPGLT